MVDKQITKLTDPLVTAVDSINKAKQYNYDGKLLKDVEKKSSKLKNDDGTSK